MKRFFIVLLFVLTFAVLGVIVFNTEFTSVDALIRPPRIEGENNEIKTAFETAVGEKYILKSPLSGEYRSSFIRTDFDGDGEEEVVVFYCYPDAVDVVRMNILDTDGEIWQSVADLESNYNDVYQISFSDLDRDSIKEIIVCWRNFETDISNRLEVYKISSAEISGLKSIFSKNHYKFFVCDVDADLQTDIIVFEKSSSNGSNEINGVYYEFSKGVPNIAGEFIVDHSISSIGEISSDREPETDNLRIYIDGYKIDSVMTTDVVRWNNLTGAFQHIMLAGSNSVSVLASRNTNINCRDVDGDSAINIPIEEHIPESGVISADSTEKIQPQTVLRWSYIDGADMNAVTYELINGKFGYSLIINPEYFGKFTVENDISSGTLTFYELYYEEEPKKDKKPKKKDAAFEEFGLQENESVQTYYRKGEELFTIFATNDTTYGAYEFSGYKHIGASDNFDYYCFITDTGKGYSITKELIKSMLIV